MPTVVSSGQNAYVSFTDATGGAQLTTSTGRFDSWLPGADDIGVDDVAMGSGLTFKYIYRTDYTASFSISSIPASSLSVGLRLKRWLESGGQVTVATQDLNANTYTCVIAPKQRVRITYDKTFLEYTMTLPVKNVNAGPMLCLYSSTLGTGYMITVTPASLALGPNTGQQTQLTANIIDPLGNPVTGVPVAWSSSNPNIASVSVSGLVTALTTGSCAIIASVGSVSVIVPVAVTLSQTANTLAMSPTSLSYTATTYTTPNPTARKSGVPTQTLTATLMSGTGQSIPITAGILAWSATGTGVSLSDQGNGTCIVTAVAGSQSGTITATVVSSVGTSNVISASATYTTVAAEPAVLIPNTYTVALTAVGQNTSLQIEATLDQYGVVVP